MKKLREREVGHIVQAHREATSAAVLKGRRSRTPHPSPCPGTHTAKCDTLAPGPSLQ